MKQSYLWAGTLGEFKACVSKCEMGNFDDDGFNRNCGLYKNRREDYYGNSERPPTYRPAWKDLAGTIKEELDEKVWIICEQFFIDSSNEERAVDFVLVGFYQETNRLTKKILLVEHKFTTTNLEINVDKDFNKIIKIEDALSKKNWIKSSPQTYKDCGEGDWFLHQSSAFIKNENSVIRNAGKQKNISLAAATENGWLANLERQFNCSDACFEKDDLVNLSKKLFY